jgi:uncharacterized membrane protein
MTSASSLVTVTWSLFSFGAHLGALRRLFIGRSTLNGRSVYPKTMVHVWLNANVLALICCCVAEAVSMRWPDKNSSQPRAWWMVLEILTSFLGGVYLVLWCFETSTRKDWVSFKRRGDRDGIEMVQPPVYTAPI